MVKYLIFLCFAFVCVFVFGLLRLHSHETQYYDDSRVMVVQGNNKRNVHWSQKYANSVINKYINITNKSDFKGMATQIIWPESAIPDSIQLKEDLKNELLDMLGRYQTLISGSTRYIVNPNGKTLEEKYTIYNSMSFLHNSGDLKYYDKTFLVPFGEYIPLKKYIPFVTKLTSGSIDFTAGDGVKIIDDVKNTRSFIPLICYESAFSGKIRKKLTLKKPEWIVNITNDSWFGLSSGPFQHFSMARFRAIEEGLPVVRAAATGFSAVIDPYGRVLQKTKLNTEDVISSKLPIGKKTVFSFFGNSIAFLVMMIFILSLFGGFWHDKFGKIIERFVNNLIEKREFKKKLKEGNEK
jgi:apolipoprotein N-acyltransferase